MRKAPRGRGKKKEVLLDVCFDYFSLLYANICGVLIMFWCSCPHYHCIIITKSPTKGGKIGPSDEFKFKSSAKGGKIGPDYECTIDRFTGGQYYYDGGCGGMTFEFSITCNKEDGGCSFTEVSVSRLSTASSYIILVMLISIFIPDYIYH